MHFLKSFSLCFYTNYRNIRNRFIKREISRYVTSGKFLEIGFGDDNLIKFFDKEFEVFGIDKSDSSVNELKAKYNPSHFKTCDISCEDIPFKEKFDVICAINVLEHIQNPKFTLKTIFDALKPKGIFAVYLPTQSNILSKMQYKILYDVKEHIFRPSIKSLKKLIEGFGFNLCQEYAASFFPLKISNKIVLESFNLYFGLWMKE